MSPSVGKLSSAVSPPSEEDLSGSVFELDEPVDDLLESSSFPQPTNAVEIRVSAATRAKVFLILIYNFLLKYIYYILKNIITCNISILSIYFA